MSEKRKLMDTLIVELRKGTIVLSVLSQIGKPEYGYTLVKKMENRGVAIDTNTLYPLLRRLEKQGLLSSEWELDRTKPRKYYKRTPYGNEIYEELKGQWNEMVNNMDQLFIEREE